MARSSPGNCSCALAVTELWCWWRELLQKRWAYASRLSSSVKVVDIAYMNWNGTQSLLALTSLTPAAVSSFLMPSTANVSGASLGRFGPVIFGHWNVREVAADVDARGEVARRVGPPPPPLAAAASAAAAAAAVRLELLGVAVGLLGVGERLGGLLLGPLAELATAAAVVVVVVVGGGRGAVEHDRHAAPMLVTRWRASLRLRLHRSRLVGGVRECRERHARRRADEGAVPRRRRVHQLSDLAHCVLLELGLGSRRGWRRVR